MLIPYDQLQPETLHNLMADFVSRDGTDGGDDTPYASGQHTFPTQPPKAMVST